MKKRYNYLGFKNPIIKQLFKRMSIFLTLFLLISSPLFSQQGITISGIVKDAQLEPLIGAVVQERGTSNGAVTNMDGQFTLIISKENATILISFVGMKPYEMTLNGEKMLDVVMQSNTEFEEVVVTALGIKRDKKSLGYALSEIKGEDLLKNRDSNVANSLTGKVAGLQINQSASGAAGSSRIVLRGNNSIDGNNQPLIVVDGIPIDGGTGANNDDQYSETLKDRGSGMADISADDIESISVLKGPAAAALYGSRAGNGVIMITTKTGKGTKGLGITYSTNLTFENPLMKPKHQNRYGQGTAGAWNASTNGRGSWGPEMKGQEFDSYTKFVDINGNETRNKIKYNPGNPDISDFLNTGTTWTNSVDITNSTENNSVRLGVMHLRNNDVVPNSDFKKTSVTLRGTANLSKQLSVDAKGTFFTQTTNNRVRLGANPDNIFYQFLRMPRSMRLSDFDLGNNGYRSELGGVINPYAYPKGTVDATTGDDLSGRPVSYAPMDAGNTANPYWSAYNNTNKDHKNRFIGLTSVKYDIVDGISLQGRYGIDYFSNEYQDIQGSGSVLSQYRDVNGNIIIDKTDGYEMNADILFTVNKNLTEKLGLFATAGGNRMYSRNSSIWSSSNGLGIEYFYNMANALKPEIKNSLYRKKINSLYATASFAWDNTFYLDLTARNDWSSALNPDNRSYFYPSVGGSWLFTESFKNIKVLDYGKIRLSWAQVGNDTDPYRLLDYRTIDGPNSGKRNPIQALYNLKNETIESYEIGLELKALNNRIGLDFAFYNKDAKDQILRMNVPPASGYTYKFVNAGNVRNRGVEVLLTGTPVKNNDFQWDVALNWSKNTNKIISLADGIERQILSHISYSSELIVVADVGGSYGDMYGKPYKRDKNGQIVVDDTGLPTFESDYVKLGNANPKWMGGISNTFYFKGIDLSFLVDMRYGGNIYMGSYRAGASVGTLDFTETGRDRMIVEGVKADGTPNNIETKGHLYWGRLSDGRLGGSEPWIYDATNVRLRELSVGYTLPAKILHKTPVKKLRMSFVGRNLWMIHSKVKGFDPETTYTTGNAQGYEIGSMPSLRSFGFNVNVSF